MGRADSNAAGRGAGSTVPLGLPDGWTVLKASGPWPFTTRARLRRPDGGEIEWRAQRHRRGMAVAHNTVRQAATLHRLTYGVAAGFGCGSILFAIGAWNAITYRWPAVNANYAFFVGAVFFTAAGLLQLWQCALASRKPSGELAWLQPRSLGWWSAATLLVGTLWFNVLTTTEMVSGLTVRREDVLVWTPDMAGSLLFLVSGYLALIEYCHGRPRLLVRRVGWWVNSTNVFGCVAFGASAIGALVLLSGALLDPRLANAGTFAGAAGFFISAVLMIVDRVDET